MHEYVWLLWDLAAVAVVYFSVRACAAKGFVHTIVSFLGYFAAAAFAWAAGPLAAGFLYDSVVRELLESAIASRLPDALEQGPAAAMIDSVLQDPVMSVLDACCFLVLFTLAAFVIRQLARVLIGVYHIPVIGTLNTVAGGVVGVLQGVLALLILSFCIRAAVSMSGGGWLWLNDSVMSETYLWQAFYFH